MNTKANWIKTNHSVGEMSPDFRKSFVCSKRIVKAEACVTALGVYNMYINGRRVGNYLFAPGYTSYENRVQYQKYDITEYLAEENTISVIVGKGWRYGFIGTRRDLNGRVKEIYDASAVSILASFEITYEDGEKQVVVTDDTWEVYSSHVMRSEHYDGDIIDLTSDIVKLGGAVVDTEDKPAVVEQMGEFIAERERVFASKLIITPKGERVIDFGQNMAGYVTLKVKGKRGDKIVISHAEVLDKYGNFYTDNLRAAKARMEYTLSGGEDILKPMFTFQGFRYIRLDEYPFEDIDISKFTAIAVYSDMKRTGDFVCGYDKLNRLYSNIIWGQRSNFVDIPTDCPQRDERLGWTGDAEVFCRTAAINYDVENFFRKWLGDVALEQLEDGGIRGVVPSCQVNGQRISAAWADAATVCPWEIYRAYGNIDMLREHYPMMKKWVEYMHSVGEEEFLWLGGNHYGDWLAMDAGYGIYIGATQTDFIASAFFAYSTALTIKAGKALGEDTSYFEELYKNVRRRFREIFMKDGMPAVYPKHDALLKHRKVKAETQTAIVLILHFGLFEESEREGLINRLVELIEENDGRMTTGFVGTPYILHALSDNGRADIAYNLLLQEKNPSWLFSVNHGATTIWEHWDSINDDGDMWDAGANSFNHYAYGSVFDWMFGDMLGIKVCEDGAGYEKIEIAPLPDKRIGFAEGSIESRHGKISVAWRYIGDDVRYEIDIPEGVSATLKLSGMKEKILCGGRYTIIK